MTTNVLLNRFQFGPVFVGGQLHSLAVPAELATKQFIHARGLAGEEVYMRTYYWLPVGMGFVFYARMGMSVDEATAIIYRAIEAGKHAHR